MIEHLLSQRCTLRNPISGPYVESPHQAPSYVPCQEDLQREYIGTEWATAASDVACRVCDGGADNVLIFLEYGVSIARNWLVDCEGRTYQIMSVNANPGHGQHHVEASGVEIWL
jgi:hypothetical protein